MLSYHYDIEKENFRRSDNRGRPLYVNISEANRIINLLNIGTTVPSIIAKIQLSSPYASETTIKSFVRNYKDGKIEIPTDAPAPSIVYDEMTNDARIDELERRIKNIEDKLDGLKDDCWVTSFAGEPQPVKLSFKERVDKWLGY